MPRGIYPRKQKSSQSSSKTSAAKSAAPKGPGRGNWRTKTANVARVGNVREDIVFLTNHLQALTQIRANYLNSSSNDPAFNKTNFMSSIDKEIDNVFHQVQLLREGEFNREWHEEPEEPEAEGISTEERLAQPAPAPSIPAPAPGTVPFNYATQPAAQH